MPGVGSPSPRSGHRVFIGLTEVAGYYRGLERGFRSIGVDARFYDESPNAYSYGPSGFLSRLSALTESTRRIHRGPAGPVLGACLRAIRFLAHAWLFAWALVRYDVFIFGGGDTLLRRRELPILRRLGKRVIWVFTGSDHRPPYLNGRWVRSALANGPTELLRATDETAQRVRIAEKYADVIVAAASSAQFHTRPFVQFIAIGIATPDGGSIPDRPSIFRARGVRILHCPSDPVSKGTSIIRRHIGTLRDAGREIDYVEITGKPNSEVLAALAECDFAIDELYSDTPMAVFATEAARFSKPVVVAGYYARQYRHDLESQGEIPPTLFCEPDQVAESIGRMVDDASFRTELGRRAFEFVSQHWSPEQVARRYLRLIDGDIAAEWWGDPLSNDYVMGWGLTETLWREGLRLLVRVAGVDRLAVAASPALRAAIERVAGESVDAIGTEIPAGSSADVALTGAGSSRRTSEP
jgi:glycosyltransferase involved in cell wall biosynthesis